MYLFRLFTIFATLFIVCYGKCPSAPLFAFIQNTTIAQTISINGTYSLVPDATDNNYVSPGSYIPLVCNSGYTLSSGQLNITCIGDAWTTFPTCTMMSASGTMNNNPLLTNNNVPCPFNQTMFTINNGYRSNVSLSPTSSNTVTGWVQFACTPGYVLDSTIGSLYICNNGVWSAQPRCLITGRCLFSTLQNFVSNATGLVTTGESLLMQLPQDTSSVINSSYIVLACIAGYTNIGGNLNVTCSSKGSWSPFPNCVLNTSGGGSLTTSAMSNSNGLYCAFNTTMLSIANGYSSNASISYTSNNLATGWIQFACMPGYALDPMVGNLYICNNGAWSTKPQCLSKSILGVHRICDAKSKT